MPFGKRFFESLGDLVNRYQGKFACGVTVTLKALGADYHLFQILQSDEHLVTFVYYDENKSAPLPKETGARSPTAWPALTIAYETIESVELTPAVPLAGEEPMGFHVGKQRP